MLQEDVVWIHYPSNYRLLNTTNEPLFTEYRSLQIPQVLFISVYRYEFFIREEPECQLSFLQKLVSGWWCVHSCAEVGCYPALEACDQNEICLLDDSPTSLRYLIAMNKSGHLGAEAKVWVRGRKGVLCSSRGRVFNCKTYRFESCSLSERHLLVAYKA
jgi:hypothetical protein